MLWILGIALADDPAPTQAPAEGAEVQVLDEASGVMQTVVQRPPRAEEKDYRGEALGVAALLGLLLLSRVNRRKAVARRPQRHTPLSVEELGRAVFQAARSADLELFRGLFLTGGEASHLLGTEGAERWLTQRSQEALVESLAALAVYCGPGTTLFESRVSGELLVLLVREEKSGEREVPVATVRQIGQAYRLFELVQG